MATDLIARDAADLLRSPLLRARPLPIVGAIGDSITAADWNGSDQTASPYVAPTNDLKGANGYLAWALILSGQRVRAPARTGVWAFPGRETSVILASLPAFLAQMPAQPGAVIVECGTNNVYHDPAGTGVGSFAAITADWTAIATYLAQRGIRTIFVPILPRVGGGSNFTQPAYTAAQYDVADRCNRWLAGFAQISGNWVAVASACLPDLTDPTSVGGQPRGGYTVDGTHPGVTGAYYIGKALAAILRLWYPPIDLLPANNLAYSAATPRANLLANAMMQGGTGTVTAPSAGTLAGTAPTSWTMSMSNTAGLTVTGSQVASPITGNPMHQFAFSGSYTVSGSSSGPTYGYYARLAQNPASVTAAIAAGDTVEALVAVEVDAGTTCLSFPQLNFRWGGSSAFNVDGQIAPRDLPAEAWQGVLRTPAHTFATPPANQGDVFVFAYAMLKSYPDGVVNAAGAVRFGRAALVKVDA